MSSISKGLDATAEECRHQRRNILLSIVETAAPVTGKGFFTIDKPMVTSFIGTALTYIVVLVQFSTSENITTYKTSNVTVLN